MSTFASTSIEGNPLPLTDVKRLLKTQKNTVRETEREVLNYNKALQFLYGEVRSGQLRLTIKTLERVQGKSDEIVFIPPDSKDVRKLLSDLLLFIENNIGKIDPVILAGIFHRQYVIIHPFIDGNGRTTRLMTTAILGKTGLDLFEVFSFENYYNRNVTRYFKEVGLQGDYYDLAEEIDFSAWLEYFAEGILDELRRVRKTLPERTADKPRLEAHHHQILDYIEAKGSITQREYGGFSTRSLAARKIDFDKLVKLNLVEVRGVGRGTYYVKKNGL